MRSVVPFLFAFASLFIGSSAQQPNSEIINLPGAPSLNFRQFSGYINVTNTQRSLFYWFVESQSSTPSSDPLVLWQTGGPGCSSLSALLGENGPFFPNTDGKTLRINPYSWNLNANVLYIESPANVGFSFSTLAADNTVGDKRTAEDLLDAINQFRSFFPSLKSVPFWLTGESYGGHYVPTLALTIVNSNKQSSDPINFKGFFVGNAWTDATQDNAGCPYMWASHGIIPDEIYNGINDNCDFSNIGPLSSSSSSSPQLCNQFVNQANKLMRGVDIYNLYKDVCDDNSKRMIKNQGEQLMSLLSDANRYEGIMTPFIYDEKEEKMNIMKNNNNNNNHNNFKKKDVGRIVPYADPCIDAHIQSYLSQSNVQLAIHAIQSLNDANEWASCSSSLDYSRSDLLSSMIPTYNALMNDDSQISINVYSGDIDGIVPVTGTKNWLRSANLTVSLPWYTWTDSEGQTGGWVQQYSTDKSNNILQFITVRDSGHMVPFDTPVRGLDLFTKVLNGQKI